MQRWALDRAMFANAYFRARNEKGELVDAPFETDDFLGRGDREQRTRDLKRKKMMAALASARITKTAPAAESDELPAWAIGEYHGGKSI